MAASVTRIVGPHALKMGGEVRIGPFNYLQLAGGSGTFAFDNRFTANNPFSPAGGYGYASYLLGTGASGAITTSQPISGQQIYRALYFQDDWRVSRKLTVNLGVRWDLAGPWSERYDRLSVFLPNADSPLAATGEASSQGQIRARELAGLSGTAPQCPANNKMFAPRVGFAYQLTPKTVLRSGYGIFYIPTALISGADPHSDVVNSQANTWVPTIDNINAFHPVQQSISERSAAAGRPRSEFRAALLGLLGGDILSGHRLRLHAAVESSTCSGNCLSASSWMRPMPAPKARTCPSAFRWTSWRISISRSGSNSHGRSPIRSSAS